MNPIFNTKNMFYDYFTHLPAMRMKNDFGLGFYEQSVIRDSIQKDIQMAFDRLVTSHDLVHANIYSGIGEEFDKNFYRELKTTLHNHFHDMNTWKFLDQLLRKTEIDDPEENMKFNSRMVSALGYGLNRNSRGQINLKEAFVALINADLDPLNGRELLYLTKIK